VVGQREGGERGGEEGRDIVREVRGERERKKLSEEERVFGERQR
jgi:hypothetical protein